MIITWTPSTDSDIKENGVVLYKTNENLFDYGDRPIIGDDNGTPNEIWAQLEVFNNTEESSTYTDTDFNTQNEYFYVFLEFPFFLFFWD